MLPSFAAHTIDRPWSGGSVVAALHSPVSIELDLLVGKMSTPRIFAFAVSLPPIGPSNLLFREFRSSCSTLLWRGCGLRKKFRCVAAGRPKDPWGTLHYSSSIAAGCLLLVQRVDVVTALSLPFAGRGYCVLSAYNGRNICRCGVSARISDEDRCTCASEHLYGCWAGRRT